MGRTLGIAGPQSCGHDPNCLDELAGCFRTYAEQRTRITNANKPQTLSECPGCQGSFPNLFKHMKRCCPEKLERSRDADEVEKQRKAMSPDDWLDQAEVRAAALAAFEAVEDPLQRRALELRFGLDNGGFRRSPIEVGQVLGGKYAKNGQTVTVLLRTAMNLIPLVADDPSNLHVLYEDASVLAVAKPPGLRTTPVHRFCGKSLTSQLVGYLKPPGGSPPPFIVHRLDQSTSGVYVCAKTKEAANALQTQWHTASCSKEYLALVHVRDATAVLEPVFTVNAAIGRSTELVDDVSRSVDGEGQPAVTQFKVLARGADVALVSCTLIDSGRTHQIRIHASHVGLPLVGDSLYGGEGDRLKSGIDRVALHAWRLRVAHPDTGDQLLITAVLPQDMDQCRIAHGIQWSQ